MQMKNKRQEMQRHPQRQENADTNFQVKNHEIRFKPSVNQPASRVWPSKPVSSKKQSKRDIIYEQKRQARAKRLQYNRSHPPDTLDNFSAQQFERPRIPLQGAQSRIPSEFNNGVQNYGQGLFPCFLEYSKLGFLLIFVCILIEDPLPLNFQPEVQYSSVPTYNAHRTRDRHADELNQVHLIDDSMVKYS